MPVTHGFWCVVVLNFSVWLTVYPCWPLQSIEPSEKVTASHNIWRGPKHLVSVFFKVGRDTWRDTSHGSHTVVVTMNPTRFVLALCKSSSFQVGLFQLRQGSVYSFCVVGQYCEGDGKDLSHPSKIESVGLTNVLMCVHLKMWLYIFMFVYSKIVFACMHNYVSTVHAAELPGVSVDRN